MKKSVFITTLLALFFSMNINAQNQEPKQKKKEKTKKECNVNGQKCCAGEEKKGALLIQKAKKTKDAIQQNKIEKLNLLDCFFKCPRNQALFFVCVTIVTDNAFLP